MDSLFNLMILFVVRLIDTESDDACSQLARFVSNLMIN